MNTLMITLRLFIGVFIFSVACSLQYARAGDMVRPDDPAEVADYARKIDGEYSYRIRVDQEGAQWAKELMLLYKWSHLYPSNLPANLRAMPDTPDAKAALQLRMRSEFAWMTITGQGILATFDFTHAEQSLLGSTSRFVAALEHSATFWLEVRRQCIEIDELKRKASTNPHRELNIEGCAARLKRDISITQAVASNVSLFVGGGILVGIGKRLFARFASKWVAARVVPLIPAFAKTRWALAGLTATAILVPAGFILASARDDQETNKVFIESLPSRLEDNRLEEEKASLLRVSLIRLEGDVLRFAIWAQREMPRTPDVLVCRPRFH